METGQRNIIILLGLIAIIALVYFAVIFKPDPRYDWNELYNHDDKEPYSNEIMLELLEGYFPDYKVTVLDKKEISESLEIDSTDKSVKNYVFIGSAMRLDSSDEKTLLDFVEQGNQAFIASKRIPTGLSGKIYENLCDTLIYIEEEEYTDHVIFEDEWTTEDDVDWEEYEEEYEVEDYEVEEETYEETEIDTTTFGKSKRLYGSVVYDTLINMNFTHPSIQRDSDYVYQYIWRNEPMRYRWGYWQADWDCENDKTLTRIELGYMDTTKSNFIKIPYGEGSFYFHANPIVFTNYHLIDENGAAYAGKVFSHLPEGDIYWDEKSKDYDFDWPDGQRNFAESPLKYILSQQSLRWAWYLMLTLVGLYVLFRAKRRQRIIPIRAANTNTSLEFIETIGKLYHQQQDHKNLVGKMMYLFDDFVRRRYGIRIKKPEEKILQRLVIKSEISRADIDNIIIRYKRLSREEAVSEDHLNSFYRALEKFYKNCK